MFLERIAASKYKVAAVIVVVLALLVVPAPLLPPHRLAEFIQTIFDVNWKLAYLFAAVGLQAVFYGSLGVVSSMVVSRTSTFQGRIVKVIVLPLVIVLIGLIIRSLKMGHLPVWINAVVPVIACVFGVWLGLSFLYKRSTILLTFLIVILGANFWFLTGGPDATLSRVTEECIEKLLGSSSSLPPGDERFGTLLQKAFEPFSEEIEVIQHHRAAILALGIVLGDERLAKFVGITIDDKMNHQITQLRNGTTLRERSDWPRHFWLSAALVVLENPVVSDAGGLMKEQLDALSRGSGFSFQDFAANRAGVRFANAATYSDRDAEAMQELIMGKFVVDDFLPPLDDFLENLTVKEFRNEFGSVGSRAYREKLISIERRLDNCIALSPLVSPRMIK